MRQRLISIFDRFVDLHFRSDTEAANLIRSLTIDILIDLTGYTHHSRPQILAARPAPIQVAFLGYPGTTGADFIDYVIADPIVAPMDQQSFFSEKIIHLPHCYQPNDSQKPIAEGCPSRAAAGLPDQGFVFCCFNNSFKITPDIFDIWMRLLRAIPGSVLWLLDANPTATDNLRREALARDVAPDRLVFAPRLPLPEHLARHRLADLFLDTLPCNAHTTASDALWAGLPVLTCLGSTFAGRVAASLLTAVGLPDLVTASLADYEALARRLAGNPGLLATLRHRLADNRLTTSLFDSARFARDLERAFETIWAKWNDEQPPAAVARTAERPA